jgi:hypothetical protein
MPQLLTEEALAVRIRLVDAAHSAWVLAQVECANALWAWFEAGAGLRRDMHLAYRAALDREEAAARDLERLRDLVPEAARR